MNLDQEQIDLLKSLMQISAKKGNLANAGLVLENGLILESSESLVISNHDATAHAERLLVEKVCKVKSSNYTPGLMMVTITEPCLMCLSACAWAGYSKVAYIIPSIKYISKIPWMSEAPKIDKIQLLNQFTEKIEFIHLKAYEDEFSNIFEEEMKDLLK